MNYTSESHYLATFQKLGHYVIPVQEGEDIKPEVVGDVRNYDMVFWVHTHGWDTPGLSQILSLAKSSNVPIVGYHLDLWLGIDRQKDLQNDDYWKRMDLFFSVDPEMVDYLNEREEMPQAFFLPAGVFENECVEGIVREKFEHDVIFVGSKNYHPEWPYRKQLIEWLESTYGDRFAHYGGDGRGIVRGLELNDLYTSAKVVVGDTLCPGFNKPVYLSDRIFETAGRNGFIIHPWISGMSEFFEIEGHVDPRDQPEVVTYQFNEFEQLKQKVDYYIENDSEREAIRKAGHERVKREHTYTHRLQSLINTVQLEWIQ